MIRRALFVIALWLTLGAAAVAQDDSALDYDAWNTIANRVEQVIDAERASDPAFETLREQLVDWRADFQAAAGLHTSRIDTLRAQIEALGPTPETATDEPGALADQRADLTARLAEAEAPGRRAEAELLRARGLIAEIDELLSDRQAGALLTHGPSPLNPANWPGAIDALYGWGRALVSEIRRLWSSPIYQAEFRENIPIIVISLIIGLALLLRGWHWVGRVMRGAIKAEETSAIARISLFFLSLAQHLVPFLGVLILVQAVEASSFVGLRTSVVLDAIPPMAIIFFVSLWVGRQVYPSRDTAPKPLNLSAEIRWRGRYAAGGLGLLLGLSHLVDQVAASEGFEAFERLVILFPIVLLTGLLLARVGWFLLVHNRSLINATDLPPVRARVYGFIGRALIVLGLAGPVLAGVGYFTAGASYLFPAALSLGLLAVLGVLHRLAANLYDLFMGYGEKQDEALTPTLIGFVVSLFSIPVFAMIWGVRQAQLLDLWGNVIEGFVIGGVTISPRSFLLFALVFVAGYTITKLVQATLRSTVLPKTKLDAGGRNAVATGTGYIGVFLAALVAITMAGIDLSSVAIVAGALSVGIGFGLQTIVSNFVSGIILLVERPIKEGDWIEVGTTMGYVRDISVRSTRIETFDRSDVIVPNADLISGVVINMTHHDNTGRVIVPVGVAYGTDTKEVETILLEIAEAHPMVLLTPPPTIIFQGFGADSLDFEIRAILRDVNWVLSVKSDMNHEITRRFGEADIEIPFAQRDVWLRNPEVLTGASAQELPSPAPKQTKRRNPTADYDGDNE